MGASGIVILYNILDNAMRPSLTDYGCHLVCSSPGVYELHRDHPDAISGTTLIGNLWLKEQGLVPEVALVEIEPRYQGKGLAQALYNDVEDHAGIIIRASDNLTYDGYRLWMRRDPSQVEGSMHRWRNQLLGKIIRDGDTDRTIVNVTNTLALAKSGGVTLPFGHADLEEMGLLPRSPEDLSSAIKDSVITENGVPILVYHGSDNAFDTFADGPTYFSPSPQYRYIKDSKVVYPAYLSIKNPYFTASQSEIEMLRSQPERIQELEGSGYDGVVYAHPGNLKKGITGWGNDHAQYLVFKRSQIINALHHPGLHKIEADLDIAADRDQEKCFLVDERGYPKTLFHSTGEFFLRFQESKDIGYHFGTKRAAMERKIQRGWEADVSIEMIEPSDLDNRCALIASGATQESLLEKAYDTLLQKLEWPRTDIRATLLAMNDSELQETIESHQALPNSDRFAERVKRAREGTTWHLRVNDETVMVFDEADHAIQARNQVRQSFMKRAHLEIRNPLRVPDLGVWTPLDIAEHAGLGSDFIEKLYADEVSESHRYQMLKEELKSCGFDGIVYKNAVEDKGSDSYIVFDAEQIHLVDPPEFIQRKMERNPRPQALDLNTSMEI